MASRGNKKHWADLSSGGYKALDELRSQGAVSAIGFGVNEVPVLLDALEIGQWDAFLLANRYNLIEQTPVEKLLPACQKAGTSLIAAGPFAAGVLAGTNVWGPSNGAYQAAPPEIVAKVAALRDVADAHGVPLGAAALQFALAHPAVCSVLTGPKSPAELDGIVKWWNTAIPSAFWRRPRRQEACRRRHTAAELRHRTCSRPSSSAARGSTSPISASAPAASAALPMRIHRTAFAGRMKPLRPSSTARLTSSIRRASMARAAPKSGSAT